MTDSSFIRAVFGLGPADIVLASRSPRRRRILERLGFEPDVVPATVDETMREGEDALEHTERLAIEKACEVAILHPDRLVVGADTIVALDGRLLGKPGDAGEAATMLERLSGRTHMVVTGVAVARGGRVVSGREETHVTFRPIDRAEIDAYVRSGEPLDKAGAYGAQALGSALVSRIDGCYYNVVGLPIVRLTSLVRELERGVPNADPPGHSPGPGRAGGFRP